MNVNNLINKLIQNVREGATCSCPIILYDNGKIELAIFTYYTIDELPLTVFGYGELIRNDGKNIIIERQELFQSEQEFIVIEEVPIVSVEKHEELYDNYYQEIQKVLDDFAAVGKIQDITNLAKAFRAIIPNEAMELYRRICPGFVDLIEQAEIKNT